MNAQAPIIPGLFVVTVRRTVTSSETFTRTIQAADEAEARAMADRVAVLADTDCPDDVMTEGNDECGGWIADEVVPTNAAPVGQDLVTSANLPEA